MTEASHLRVYIRAQAAEIEKLKAERDYLLGRIKDLEKEEEERWVTFWMDDRRQIEEAKAETEASILGDCETCARWDSKMQNCDDSSSLLPPDCWRGTHIDFARGLNGLGESLADQQRSMFGLRNRLRDLEEEAAWLKREVELLIGDSK
jgi:uncharacterized coiled-coil protein SlyX